MISFRDGEMWVASDEKGRRDFIGTKHRTSGVACFRDPPGSNNEYCTRIMIGASDLPDRASLLDREVGQEEIGYRVRFNGNGCSVSDKTYRDLTTSPIYNYSGRLLSATCRKL